MTTQPFSYRRFRVDGMAIRAAYNFVAPIDLSFLALDHVGCRP
jgi:hypothetical protein